MVIYMWPSQSCGIVYFSKIQYILAFYFNIIVLNYILITNYSLFLLSSVSWECGSHMGANVHIIYTIEVKLSA